MTITEFLLARLADDEAVVLSMPERWGPYRRLFAHCKASRRIMECHTDVDYGTFEGLGAVTMCRECRDQRGPCATLRHIAAVYADHPDYGEGWNP